MLMVANDTHGSIWMMNQLVESNIRPGDIVIANGDFVGSRGPVLNGIVRLFYDVRRGTTTFAELQEHLLSIAEVTIDQDLVYSAVHSGTFIAELQRESGAMRRIVDREAELNIDKLKTYAQIINARGAKLLYLPGNCEVMISDFDVSGGVREEKLVPPEQRLFNQFAKRGTFGQSSVDYVNQPRLLEGETLLLPLDSIDEWAAGHNTILDGIDPSSVKRVITHYPPRLERIERLFGALFLWTPNGTDVTRMGAVSDILGRFPNLEEVVYGHIHTTLDRFFLESLPEKIQIKEGDIRYIWNRPGNILNLSPRLD